MEVFKRRIKWIDFKITFEQGDFTININRNTHTYSFRNTLPFTTILENVSYFLYLNRIPSKLKDWIIKKFYRDILQIIENLTPLPYQILYNLVTIEPYSNIRKLIDLSRAIEIGWNISKKEGFEKYFLKDISKLTPIQQHWIIYSFRHYQFSFFTKEDYESIFKLMPKAVRENRFRVPPTVLFRVKDKSLIKNISNRFDVVKVLFWDHPFLRGISKPQYQKFQSIIFPQLKRTRYSLIWIFNTKREIIDRYNELLEMKIEVPNRRTLLRKWKFYEKELERRKLHFYEIEKEIKLPTDDIKGPPELEKYRMRTYYDLRKCGVENKNCVYTYRDKETTLLYRKGSITAEVGFNGTIYQCYDVRNTITPKSKAFERELRKGWINFLKKISYEH